MMTDPDRRHADPHPQRGARAPRAHARCRSRSSRSTSPRSSRPRASSPTSVEPTATTRATSRSCSSTAATAQRHRRHPPRLAPGAPRLRPHDRIPRVLSGMGIVDPQHLARRDERPKRDARRSAASCSVRSGDGSRLPKARRRRVRCQSRVGKRPVDVPKGGHRRPSKTASSRSKGPKGTALPSAPAERRT